MRDPSSRLWGVVLCGMVVTYALLAGTVLANVLRGSLWALLLALPLADGPRRVRRWLHTGRAFARLRRDQQQLVAAVWWLGAAATLAMLLTALRP